jgi:hypothetical protein
MKRTSAPALAALSLALFTLQPAAAQETDLDKVRDATAKLIGILVEQGVLSRDKAEALLDDVRRPAAAAPARPAAAAGAAATDKPGPGTVRVPYIPEFVRNEIKEEVRSELAAQAFREGWAGPGNVPAWVRSLKFEGDLRTRAQIDDFASGNAPAINVNQTNATRSLVLLNTTENRERLRVRARLGLTADIDPNWSAGLRLSTGNLSDPVSTNQTLGNYNNRYTVAFDRAFVRYRYGDEFNVVAGRFGNPWMGTDLVWANELSFDGVAVNWTPRLTPTLRGFGTLGALPVQEVELASADKWLFGAQAGVEASQLFGQASGKLGLGYFKYTNMVGETNPPGSSVNDFTAPAFAQKGNTYFNISSDPNRPLLALASKYELLNLTGVLTMPVTDGKVVVLTGDYVENLGFSSSQVSQRVGTNVDSQTTGYLVRASFGDAEVNQRHAWQVFAGYKRVERDAVLDGFTDSDFRLGGTDAKGYILGGSYGLAKNVSATGRLLSADSVSGAPLSVDVIQFDLLVRF